MRILIIDDDPDIRDILTIVLKAEGHEVATAVDGLEGLERLRSDSRPSLIFVDMMMPRLDGRAFLEAMRRDPRLADVPVVVLTGHPAARKEAKELGTAGYLVKPVELDDLLGTIRRAEVHASA